MESSFYSVLADFFTEETVIQEYQNAPAPARPYVSFFVTAAEPQGHAEMLSVDEEGMAVCRQFFRVTLNIQYHGDNAVNRLNEFHMHCVSRLQFDDLFPGIGMIEWDSVKPVPTLEGIDWMERSIYSPVFLVELRTTGQELSYIENVTEEKIEE